MTIHPRNPRPVISCVVPAFNEADNLGPLLTDLSAQLAHLSERSEIIVVDDGSQDATPAAMAPWIARPGVRYVRLSRNFGKEAALTAGLDRAVGEVVLLIDADRQHPVTLVPRMLAAWHQGADMVCAARASRADESFAKRIGTALFYRLVNHNAAVQIPADAGDFRLLDRRVVDALKSLPLPRLVALELDRLSPPDFDSLRAALIKQFKGVTLDDHRQWQQQIRTVTRSFALAGIAILLLVGAATTAIIISATRAAMASNREIVEVLHFVGATDRFIAREFERNFMRVGIRAGLVGAGSAMVVFAIMPTLMELLGGGSMSLAEMRRLVGAGALDLLGYGVLAGLVVVVAALCMFTSRFSVYRILHSRN